MQIAGIDATGNQGGASTDSGSGKGKSKEAPRIVLGDTEVSLEEDDVPLQRRRLFHSDGYAVSRPRRQDSRLSRRLPHLS
jgi:hypothetical protein